MHHSRGFTCNSNVTVCHSNPGQYYQTIKLGMLIILLLAQAYWRESEIVRNFWKRFVHVIHGYFTNGSRYMLLLNHTLLRCCNNVSIEENCWQAMYQAANAHNLLETINPKSEPGSILAFQHLCTTDVATISSSVSTF